VIGPAGLLPTRVGPAPEGREGLCLAALLPKARPSKFDRFERGINNLQTKTVNFDCFAFASRLELRLQIARVCASRSRRAGRK
jgi:hypothetical protein